ncbi:dehydrogenase/reductase SDR family member 8 precursor [Metarhizium album ARSEF 1941]|uniref:Hydroxynaphthalene reductase-like protein Arp2 n=1 Tax=Metarhizium album (strain ARSEF 1941) TaxID=1081103 RepID=A0A0B2WPX7_METAS|nr:dehydrogenase/reductase SDR family member 8 precursor [Metarhizium album ARSEF 1941]KHN95542.1 dehydrogenase/reductase SDR family member 8 precursor [Metarhizium album ARSEF 1941]
MSLLYLLQDSIVGKSISAAADALANPLVPGALLLLLSRAPEATLQRLLERASLPPDHGLALAKSILRALLAVGTARHVNAKLSSMAANSWRLGGAPGWDWPREVAVVTGGSSGIGLAIVHKLVAAGVKVAVFDVQPLPPQLQAGPLVRYYRCDVTSASSIADAATGVRRDLGQPTILVNNAGIAVPKTVLDIDEKALQRIFAINTMSHWLTVQQFLPSMLKANKGHIVTMASVASFVGLPGHADYGSTKASALAFHEALQAEIKHVYHAPNVMTTIVHPNFVATPLLDGFKGHLASSGVSFLTPEQVAEDTVAQIFARKAGQVVVPKASGAASVVRGLPLWLQVLIHNFMGANAKKLTGR